MVPSRLKRRLVATNSPVSSPPSRAPAVFGGPAGAADFAQRFGDAFGGSDATQTGDGQAGARGRGGRGAPGAFGPGSGFGGRAGRGANNQIRGNLSQSVDASALDT